MWEDRGDTGWTVRRWTAPSGWQNHPGSGPGFQGPKSSGSDRWSPLRALRLNISHLQASPVQLSPHRPSRTSLYQQPHHSTYCPKLSNLNTGGTILLFGRPLQAFCKPMYSYRQFLCRLEGLMLHIKKCTRICVHELYKGMRGHGGKVVLHMSFLLPQVHLKCMWPAFENT